MELHRDGLENAEFLGFAAEMIQPIAWLRKTINAGGAIMNLNLPKTGGFADHARMKRERETGSRKLEDTMNELKRYRAVAFKSDCIQVVTLLEIDLATQCGSKRETPEEAISWQIRGNRAIREHLASEGKSYAEPPSAPRRYESWWKAGTNEREVTVDDLAIVMLRDAPVRTEHVENESGGADEQTICLCCGAVVAQRKAILSPQERVEALQAKADSLRCAMTLWSPKDTAAELNCDCAACREYAQLMRAIEMPHPLFREGGRLGGSGETSAQPENPNQAQAQASPSD